MENIAVALKYNSFYQNGPVKQEVIMKNRTFVKSLLLLALFAPFAHTMKKNEAVFVYPESKDVHYAAANGNMQWVKLFIEEVNPANLEATTSDKETPLHIACRHNQIEVVKYLLSKDANVEAKNKFNETPLLIATKNRNLAIVKLLVTAGANVNTKNKKKEHALHLATVKNDIKIMKILLDSLADENLRKKYLEQADKEGMRPLHIASYYGKEEAVKLLVGYGADIEAKAENNKKDDDQCCASTCCTSTCCGDSNEEQDELHDDGCCTGCCCDCNCKEYGNGETPLMLASMSDDKNIVVFLLDKGANVHAKDNCGHTSLHLADNEEIAKFLLENGADIEAKNKYDETPLQCSENPEIIKFLLENGADVSKTLGERTKNTKIIKLLLENGADIEDKTYSCGENMIPLIMECTNCSPNISKICTLIERGSPVPEPEYSEETDQFFVGLNDESMMNVDKNTGRLLSYYRKQGEHFAKYCLDPLGKKGLLRHIKKLMFCKKVPTSVKKFAMPFFIMEKFRRNDIFPCFEQISFDSVFLTEVPLRDAVRYAIKHNLKDINKRTILDAAIILNQPQIIPMVIELNENAYRNNLCKAYLHLLIKDKFNPEYEKSNNLIKMLRNVKIMKDEKYNDLRRNLFKSLTFLHNFKKILPDELAKEIMGYYYDDGIPVAPDITEAPDIMKLLNMIESEDQ